MANARVLTWLLLVLIAVGALVYARSITPKQPDPDKTVMVEVITGGPDAFWQIVTAGARDAAEEYNVELTVHEPAGGGDAQTEILTKIDAEQTDGVAISPLVPDEQSRLISLLAAETKVITFDNDAPRSTRLCYIGTNNWSAGQLCADLIGQALPEGGKVALFVGDYQRDNARHRRQALLAALEGKRPNQKEEHPDLDKPITIGDYIVVKTYLDDSDPEKAKANVTKALEDHPDLNCLVGLYGYNGPACLEALKDADKLGEIKVVAFDEHEPTLEGIAAGHVVGTVVQKPYSYGFEAVRLLADLNRRPDTAVPYGGSGSINLPCEIVNQENLDEFESMLEERLQRTTKPSKDAQATEGAEGNEDASPD